MSISFPSIKHSWFNWYLLIVIVKFQKINLRIVFNKQHIHIDIDISQSAGNLSSIWLKFLAYWFLTVTAETCINFINRNRIEAKFGEYRYNWKMVQSSLRITDPKGPENFSVMKRLSLLGDFAPKYAKFYCLLSPMTINIHQHQNNDYECIVIKNYDQSSILFERNQQASAFEQHTANAWKRICRPVYQGLTKWHVIKRAIKCYFLLQSFHYLHWLCIYFTPQANFQT